MRRCSLWIALAVTGSLGFENASIAQSGGGYDFTWSTVYSAAAVQELHKIVQNQAKRIEDLMMQSSEQAGQIAAITKQVREMETLHEELAKRLGEIEESVRVSQRGSK